MTNGDKRLVLSCYVTITIIFLQKITQNHVDVIALYVGTENTKYIVAQFLQEVAAKDAKMVDKHGDRIIKAINEDGQLGGVAYNTLVALACIDKVISGF